MNKVIKIHPTDNVGVCLQNVSKGEIVNVEGAKITALQDIPAGHKLLLADTEAKAQIIKYGYPIGHIDAPLKKGSWINEHVLITNLKGTLDYTYEPTANTVTEQAIAPLKNSPKTFMGYERKNGDVGIRNEIWVVPTVGCVNGVAQKAAMMLEMETKLEGIDGVHAWTHNFGCSQLGDDHENTRKVLRDICLHPNAGGVLIVGLGCENNQPDDFMQTLGDYDRDRIRLVVTQKVPGDELNECLRQLREIYAIAKQDKRTEQPISKLRVGLKCGGSDGFSGITANPLVGRFSDALGMLGGTTILTEIPEMFGAEQMLLNRCVNKEKFEQLATLINDFKNYFLSHGEPVGENPSPGNKAGGISTLEDKSLGCVQKGGQAQVEGILRYGDRLEHKGLNILSAPGNDLVAATALAASGCQLVLFTTGRGTPFGTFVPTMKISTNNQIFAQKPGWIDFNAGALLEGTSWDTLTKDFYEKIVKVASGEQTRNEENGFADISIFKDGVTL